MSTCMLAETGKMYFTTVSIRQVHFYCPNIHTTAQTLFIMSHSLLRRHIVLLTVGFYSSNHGVLYTIVISMTRRFQKSVGPSVCLSVCNANKKKPTPPSLITVE